MPRLPTAQDLGNSERLRSQNVVPIQLGRTEAAQVQTGQSLSNLGRAVTDAALRVADRHDRLEYVKQKSTFLQEMVRAESEIGSEDDTDYKTYGQRFQERLAKTKNEALGKIKNVSMRAQFEADIDLDIEQGLSRMAKKSWQMETENALASTQEITARNRELFLQSKSPEVRQSIMDAQQKSIAVMVENGYISKDKAEEMGRQVAADFAIGKLTVMDPDQAIAEIKSGRMDSFLPEDKREILIDKFESESISNLRNQEWIKQQAREELFNQQSLVVEQTGSIKDIPPVIWSSMDKSQRDALTKQAKAVAEGQEIPTDWTEYYALKTLASDPSTQAEFKKIDLTSYRGKLGNAEYKELMGVQSQVRQGKKSTELDGYRTNAQIVNDTLNAAGIDPTPKPGNDAAKKVSEFRRQVDQQIAALQEKTGKKVTNDEVQNIVDNLIVKGTVPGSGFIFDDKKRLFELEPGETLVVKDIEEISLSERRKIEAALNRAGRPVNEEQILMLYNKKLSK